MSTATVDSKKRVVLPSGRPGDVYDVQQQDDGHVLLVRLEPAKRHIRISRRACLDAMRKSPLQPRMTWDELRKLTREP